MPNYRRIKGTQDILPFETPWWQYIETTIRRCMSIYNYSEMRTPVFEQTDLFARGIGQATDIVSKEMYTFQDRGKKSLTLKPEMTAPIMRAYIENNLSASNPLNKIYYIAPLFRQENPQAGRLRQFTQFGAEAIGSPSPEIDAELILLALKVYAELGIKKLNLVINTVDNPESRTKYKALLKKYFKPNLNKYCRDCQNRYETNTMRILDCKVETCKELNRNAPRLIDHLSPEGQIHFDRVQQYLKENGTEYTINPHLVRGLDYYTHTVFEITSGDLGSQDAICGGGRYDMLSKQLGGADTPAVGFASGMERLLMVMEAQGLLAENRNELDVYLCALGEPAVISATTWIERLRAQGFSADRDYQRRSLKAQMRDANRQNARIVLMLGDSELAEEQFLVKDMGSGDQENVPFAKIGSFLAGKLKK